MFGPGKESPTIAFTFARTASIYPRPENSVKKASCELKTPGKTRKDGSSRPGTPSTMRELTLVPVVRCADFRQLEGVISQGDVRERYREFGEG